MSEEKKMLYILWRDSGGSSRPMYVSETPGDGGRDWGYNSDIKKAKPLSGYWRQRFFRDTEYVGMYAHSLMKDEILKG